MATIEMQYNGQSNLIVGHRIIRPGQTFFIDDKEIADYISPAYVSAGLITYVNNNGLPAGTISASLVVMQEQTYLDAGDVQNAMVQISNFIGTASGTLGGLQVTQDTMQGQVQVNQSNILQLQTNVDTNMAGIETNTNNISSLGSTLSVLNTNISNLTTQVNDNVSTLATKVTEILFQAITFNNGISSVNVTHNVGNTDYKVAVTPTSNPGSGTFWVQKDIDNALINITSLAPGQTVTADVLIMS